MSEMSKKEIIHIRFGACDRSLLMSNFKSPAFAVPRLHDCCNQNIPSSTF